MLFLLQKLELQSNVGKGFTIIFDSVVTNRKNRVGHLRKIKNYFICIRILGLNGPRYLRVCQAGTD